VTYTFENTQRAGRTKTLPPTGWKEPSLNAAREISALAAQKILALNSGHEPFTSINVPCRSQIYQSGFNQAWEDLTKRSCQESAFTVVIPICNEHSCIESMLECLFSSFVPSSVDLRIVFVTNGTSDGSDQIIDRFLSEMAEAPPLRQTIPSAVAIPTKGDLLHFQIGNHHAYRLSLACTGKIFALQAGSQLAKTFGHRGVLCLDADSWVQPDSLAKMYAGMVKANVENPEGTPIVFGDLVSVLRREPHSHFNSFLWKTQNDGFAPANRRPGSGTIVAWNIDWLLTKIPPSAVEDISFKLLCAMEGKEPALCDAKSWNYRSGTFKDQVRASSRAVFGCLQVLANFEGQPEYNAIARKLYQIKPLAKPKKEHWKDFLASIRKEPKKCIHHALRFAALFYIRLRGEHMFRKTPTFVGWERLDSTK
jgi:hypothetical protein